MRVSRLRSALAAAILLVLGLSTALAACSSASSGGSSAGDGGDAASQEAAPGSDATTDVKDSSPGGDATGDSQTDVADVGAEGESGADAGAEADSGSQDASVTDSGSLFPTDGGDCGAGSIGEPTELRCTGLYADWDSKTVATGVVEYDPGLHLWSDGADKTRWIYLPPGSQIDTSNMDEWTFPVGTKIWKEFRLPLGDAGADTRIETRLLWKLSAGTWYRTTYRWSADGETSTAEEIFGELDAGGTGYEVPSQFECNTCHNGRIDGVLGFEAVALSTFGATPVTTQTLAAQSLLSSPPAAPIVIPGDATEVAALAYMHTNCGIACHNANGAASFTGFFMRLDVATLASVQSTNAYTTGWNVPTNTYAIPGAAVSYRIHACDLAESCAYYRADHRDDVDGAAPGTQMPPVDSHVVDQAGIAAIAAWIEHGCGDAGAGGDGG
ncbi:MAG: hypothetical protein ACRELB_01900 [Polyangiaceae bacterium]